MNRTLVIVACGARKIWDDNPNAGPTPAKDAYTGAPFKVNRRYAETFSDKWVILSAKYGFINPDFIIPENYNVTFKKPSTNPVSIDTLKKQIIEMGLDRYDKIVVLGGREYVNAVTKAFEEYNVKIEAPLKDLPLGKAMKKVKEALSTGKPFDC